MICNKCKALRRDTLGQLKAIIHHPGADGRKEEGCCLYLMKYQEGLTFRNTCKKSDSRDAVDGSILARMVTVQLLSWGCGSF